MVIRRIIWIILIALSVILYIFVNGPATLSLPVALLIIPIVSYILMRTGTGRISAELDAPAGASKNTAIPVKINRSDKRAVSSDRIKALISCKNLRTGEENETETGSIGNTFTITSSHCGTIMITIKKLISTDFLGMFRHEKPCDISRKISILPKSFDMEIALSAGASAQPEGDRYSRTQSGEDSAETLGIREYVPGDPVKNMHWKLSGKTDKLLVREFGLPLVDQVAVFLDMSCTAPPDPKEADITANVFATILETFLDEDIQPVAGWQDPSAGDLKLTRISTDEELADTLSEAMGIPILQGGVNVSMASASSGIRHGFAHVIVVGADTETDPSMISNGATATLLVPDTGGAGSGKLAGGTRILMFNADDYKKELAYVEI